MSWMEEIEKRIAEEQNSHEREDRLIEKSLEILERAIGIAIRETNDKRAGFLWEYDDGFSHDIILHDKNFIQQWEMYKTDCRNAFLGYNIGQYTKKYDTMRNIDFNYIQSALYNILINRGCKTVDMIIGPVYLTETLYRIETCFWGNKRVPYTDTITVYKWGIMVTW